jgi:hypothetical protein
VIPARRRDTVRVHLSSCMRAFSAPQRAEPHGIGITRAFMRAARGVDAMPSSTVVHPPFSLPPQVGHKGRRAPRR